MKLSWGNKVDHRFRDAVIKMCKELGWGEPHASWMMACIAFETADTFDPAIRNAAGSGATGLIQFMPRTALGLGTDTDKLAAMDAPEQMVYVQKYMKPYANSIHSLSDMYMAILAPKAVGKADTFVLYSDGAAYRMNSPLDTDSDGTITKAEASQFVRSKLVKGYGFGKWINIAWNDNDSVLAMISEIKTRLVELETMIGG